MTLFSNVSFPAGIAFASDGSMYFTEREGRVRVARNGRLEAEPIASGRTTTLGETGFLGLAVSPDDRWVYVFGTDASRSSNNVLRVPADGGELEEVITGLPAGGYHNGGGVAFDLEGYLLVSNGEVHDGGRAQDPVALGGKVYRYTPEGEPAPRNPFGDAPTYALGLRNPFGLAIDPVSAAPFVTENGPSSFDEVNRIESGGNYGWPAVSGPAEDVSEVEATLPGRYHDPLLAYEEIIVPTGITFAPIGGVPSRIAGDLFFGTFRERTIHRVQLNRARDAAISDEIFWQEEDPIIAVAWGPRGLYYSTPSAIKLFPFAAAPGSATRVTPHASRGPSEGGLRVERIVLTVLGVGAVSLFLIVLRKRKGRA